MKRNIHQTPFRGALAAAALLAVATGWLQAQSQSEGVIAQSAESDFRRSLVRVELGFAISGAMLKDRFLPEIQIEEKAEYWGAVIDPRGLIVVHAAGFDLFLKNPNNIRAFILSSHGRYRSAELLGIDKRTEMALLHSDEFNDRELPLTEDLHPSSLFLASFSGGQWKVDTLRVRSLRTEKNLPEATLALNPSGLGGSKNRLAGSLVLNQEGKLAGLITRYKPSLSDRQNAVFRMLPTSVLLASVRRIAATHRSIEAGWLGVMPDFSQGKVRLVEVFHQSPAEQAGLQAGDALLKVGGEPLACWDDLGLAIRWKGSGNRLDLTVARAGHLRHLTALLQDRPVEEKIWAIDISEGVPARMAKPSPGQLRYHKTQLFTLPQLGVILEPLNARTASKLKVPSEKGLIIRYIGSDSLAARYFRSGDVVIRINDQKLCCASELYSALPNSKDGRMVIEFYRDGELQTVEVNAASWVRVKK